MQFLTVIHQMCTEVRAENGAGVKLSEAYSESTEIFLPTKAVMMFESLLKAFPTHTLLMADFHQLPDVSIPGKNAPLVAATVSAGFL